MRHRSPRESGTDDAPERYLVLMSAARQGDIHMPSTRFPPVRTALKDHEPNLLPLFSSPCLCGNGSPRRWIFFRRWSSLASAAVTNAVSVKRSGGPERKSTASVTSRRSSAGTSEVSFTLPARSSLRNHGARVCVGSPLLVAWRRPPLRLAPIFQPEQPVGSAAYPPKVNPGRR
jgi:hypothetical protein